MNRMRHAVPHCRISPHFTACGYRTNICEKGDLQSAGHCGAFSRIRMRPHAVTAWGSAHRIANLGSQPRRTFLDLVYSHGTSFQENLVQ
jgi:hypothetical protein